MLRERILAAGADDGIWASQFGFRPGRSTERKMQSLFLADGLSLQEHSEMARFHCWRLIGAKPSIASTQLAWWMPFGDLDCLNSF